MKHSPGFEGALLVRLRIYAVLVVLIATVAMTGCLISTRRTVYWPAGAIFSENGDSVYFVIRKTDVTERGLHSSSQVPKEKYRLCEGGGVFGPSHRVTVWSDEISLRRIRLADGVTEELMHWRSTPRTGTTSEVYNSFCYPAAAVMDWVANHKLRIAISLVESLQTTEALWSEGESNGAPSFKYYNPGYAEGHLNVARVHGNLEVVPLRGDDYVAAYVLYDWMKPEAHFIALEPPGASFRTAQVGSLLLAATLRSRHVEAENERMRNILFARFVTDGMAKGLGFGTDYALAQMKGLPQYARGSRQHVRQLTNQQVDSLRRGDAFTPLLDFNSPNLAAKLNPEVLETLERLPSTDSNLAGTVLNDLATLAGPYTVVLYVRKGERTFEIRWY
jgi:hypothetical protein